MPEPCSRSHSGAARERGQATLASDLSAVIAYLPSLGAGSLIFVIGIAIAFLGGKVAAGLAARLGLDRLGERRGVSDDLQSIGVRTTLSRILGRLVFFIIALATLVQTVDALHLTPLAAALALMLGFVPRIILAIVILVLGAAISDALAEAVTLATKRAGILYDAVLAGIVRWLILVLAVLMALQQLTIDATFLLDVLVLVLGGFVVALAIAGGWGTRTIVETSSRAGTFTTRSPLEIVSTRKGSPERSSVSTLRASPFATKPGHRSSYRARSS